MKRSNLLLIVLALAGGSAMTSCDSAAQKLKNAEDAQADTDLAKSNQEYLADMENYKKETDEKIAENQKRIADFQTKVINAKKETKAAYAEKIAELEQRNTDLKKKLGDFRADGKEQWETFKTEFTNDLDELGQSFQELTAEEPK